MNLYPYLQVPLPTGTLTGIPTGQCLWVTENFICQCTLQVNIISSLPKLKLLISFNISQSTHCQNIRVHHQTHQTPQSQAYQCLSRLFREFALNMRQNKTWG